MDQFIYMVQLLKVKKEPLEERKQEFNKQYQELRSKEVYYHQEIEKAKQKIQQNLYAIDLQGMKFIHFLSSLLKVFGMSFIPVAFLASFLVLIVSAFSSTLVLPTIIGAVILSLGMSIHVVKQSKEYRHLQDIRHISREQLKQEVEGLKQELASKNEDLAYLGKRIESVQRQNKQIEEDLAYLNQAIQTIIDIREQEIRQLLDDPMIEQEMNEAFLRHSDLLSLVRKLK